MGAVANVPAKNSSANATIADVLGNKTDDEDGNSLAAKAYILGRHAHSEQKVYPTLAAGVTVTAPQSAWALTANAVEIVPVNTITSPFDIHGVNFDSVSASDVYEIVLYTGADVEIGRARFTRGSSGVQLESSMQTPLIPANTQIKAKIACAGGGKSAVISLRYHVY